jgi:hypothetical protein
VPQLASTCCSVLKGDRGTDAVRYETTFVVELDFVFQHEQTA